MSSANETWCDADVTITPSDNNVSYIIGGVDKATFDAEYASNLDGLYEKEKAQWVKEEEWYNKTWIENMQYYLYNGEVSETASYLIGMERLSWASEYVIYCFGVNTETGAKTTDVHTLTVETATPTPSANTFTITIDAMTRSSVDFTVTTTNDDPYYVTVQKKSVVDAHSEDLIEYLMSSVTDAQLESRTFTGTQTLKNSQVGTTVNGFYEYQIIVWGFENGPTTAATVSEAFKPADPVVEE